MVLSTTIRRGLFVEFSKRTEALLELLKADWVSEEALPLMEAWTDLVEEAVAEDNYLLAERATRDGLIKAANLTKDLKLIEATKQRAQEIEVLRKEHLKLGPATLTLRRDPDDQAANSTMGKFYCFYKRDWLKGLPYLAKGEDADLRAIAALDIAGTSASADTMVEIADVWWKLAGKAEDTPTASMRTRALYWYHNALPKLTGLLKTRIERQLDDLEKETAKEENRLDLKRFQVLCFTASKSRRAQWTPMPLEKMSITVKSTMLLVKNTTGIFYEALFASNQELRGDFDAIFEVYGGKSFGILSSSFGPYAISIRLRNIWQKIRIQRRAGVLTFTINGRKAIPYGRSAKQSIAGYLYIGLGKSQQCMIRNVQIKDLAPPDPRARRRR